MELISEMVTCSWSLSKKLITDGEAEEMREKHLTERGSYIHDRVKMHPVTFTIVCDSIGI